MLRRNQKCQRLLSQLFNLPQITLSGLPDEVTPSQNDVSSPSPCGEYHQCVISSVEPGTIKYIDANCEMSDQSLYSSLRFDGHH